MALVGRVSELNTIVGRGIVHSLYVFWPLHGGYNIASNATHMVRDSRTGYNARSVVHEEAGYSKFLSLCF